MDWVSSFYRRQNEWTGVYEGEISARHRQKAQKVVRLATPPPARVLELGAGGGQVAAACAELGYDVVALELLPELARHAEMLAERVHASGVVEQGVQWDTVLEGSLSVIQGDFYKEDPGAGLPADRGSGLEANRGAGLPANPGSGLEANPGSGLVVDSEAGFDVVCYWDGFGIGTDADPRKLLKRISGWLRPGGCALIDVYTPWFWAARAGTEQQIRDITRRYGFDTQNCRMLDTWWRTESPEAPVTQSLRCYSPADLRILLEGTGLALKDVKPGGTIDTSGRFLPEASLAEAMDYTAILVPSIVIPA